MTNWGNRAINLNFSQFTKIIYLLKASSLLKNVTWGRGAPGNFPVSRWASPLLVVGHSGPFGLRGDFILMLSCKATTHVRGLVCDFSVSKFMKIIFSTQPFAERASNFSLLYMSEGPD